MNNRLYLASLAMACVASPLVGQNLLTNGNFDAGSLAGWTSFGNAYAEAANAPQFVPYSGTHLVSMFGNFTGGFNVSGIFQSFRATPGQSFTLDCWSRHYSADPMVGVGAPNNNWAVMKIAFFDGQGAEIGGAEGTILDGTSPTDVWIDNAPVTGVAPAGAVAVQALILYLQPLFDGGACQVDDVVFTTTAPSLKISLGVRETGSTAAIGADGGSAGQIEWINKDVPILTLDGQWQQFSFRVDPNSAPDPVTSALGTGDGLITASAGTLEHIRVLNFQGLTDEITLWVDDVNDNVNGSDNLFGTFEGYADGAAMMFQPPGYSGSTASNVAAGSTSGAYNYTASRAAPGSQYLKWAFVDNSPTRWIRMTTFSSSITTLPQRNPTISFTQGSVVSFWLRGTVKEQPNLGSQGPGNAIAELVGTGLSAGEQCTLYLGGLPANAPGVMAISADGFADVPFLGGNLVSFGGFLTTEVLNADVNGQATRLIPGFAPVGNIVLQSAHLDPSLMTPLPLTFSNAVKAQFGQ